MSWRRGLDGRWTARLSSPETVRTLERSARTRTRALARAIRALRGLIRIRAELARGDLPVPKSGEVDES